MSGALSVAQVSDRMARLLVADHKYFTRRICLMCVYHTFNWLVLGNIPIHNYFMIITRSRYFKLAIAL